MNDLNRARIAAVLGTISAAVSQLAEAKSMGVADWEADVTVEKPWSTLILEDGTRVRITVEVEDVSDPVATLQGNHNG